MEPRPEFRIVTLASGIGWLHGYWAVRGGIWDALPVLQRRLATGLTDLPTGWVSHRRCYGGHFLTHSASRSRPGWCNFRGPDPGSANPWFCAVGPEKGLAQFACPVVSHLSKDGHITGWVGPDNYFSHPAATFPAHNSACVAPPIPGSTMPSAAPSSSSPKAIPELLAKRPRPAHHRFLARLWEQRVGVINYRKNVTDSLPESEFADTQVPGPSGGSFPMRLTYSGHQTAARTLASPTVAGRMFSRWSQDHLPAHLSRPPKSQNLPNLFPARSGCLNLRDLTGMTGISYAHLSRTERGLAQPRLCGAGAPGVAL